MRRDIKDFLKSVLSIKEIDGPCIEWPFSKTAAGYGIVGYKHYAHRLICTIVYGPAPVNKAVVAHSCHNKACVRPIHLRWTTYSENMYDQATNITAVYKLTTSQVMEIRNSKESNVKIAHDYKITPTHVGRIKSVKTRRRG